MHNRFLKSFHFIDEFDKDHIRSLNQKIIIIYRNYKKKYNEQQILKLKTFCKSLNKKLFLSNDIELVTKLNLDGAYIPSFNKDISVISLKNKNITLIGSAHNLREINEKKKQKMDLIVLSPIFEVPKSFNSLGVIRFNLLSSQIKSGVVALGGIDSKNIKKLNILRCDGFAGISYFKKLSDNK
jgi:thiamine-phosphate pyrophosphorylase